MHYTMTDGDTGEHLFSGDLIAFRDEAACDVETCDRLRALCPGESVDFGGDAEEPWIRVTRVD